MFELTRHARERLAARGISESDLEHAYARQIGKPEPGSAVGSMVVVGPLPEGRGRLKIVIAGDDPIRVITAWRLDGG